MNSSPSPFDSLLAQATLSKSLAAAHHRSILARFCIIEPPLNGRQKFRRQRSIRRIRCDSESQVDIAIASGFISVNSRQSPSSIGLAHQNRGSRVQSEKFIAMTNDIHKQGSQIYPAI